MKYAFYLILFAAFLFRLIPVLNNHFYFTIDQGRDAVYVRDLLYGNFPIFGPETDIEGVHHGVFWYYILAIPYALSFGSPFSAVVFFIIIHIASIFLVGKYIKNKYGDLAAVLITIGLAFLLPFYETSRYAFNPFLIVPLLLLSLTYLSETKKINNPSLVFIGSVFGLSLHSELAIFIPFSLILFSVLIFYSIRKIININQISIVFLSWFVFLIPFFFSELTSDFSQFKSMQKHLSAKNNVFEVSFTQNFIETNKYFGKLLGESIFPHLPFIGIIIFISVFVFWLIKNKKQIDFFPVFSVLIFVVSILWFSTNRGIKDWHVLYLPPLIFLSLAIMLFSFKKTGMIIFGFILASHMVFTGSRVISYWQNQTDAGLLNNQLNALDWVYEKSENNGFYLYNYVPSVKDYHYQYLIYWHGKSKYGYVPCEYSTFPQTSADSYVPHAKNYQEPQKPCDKDVFLIMDKAVDEGLKNQWYNEVSKNMQSIEKVIFGEIGVEKLRKN